MSELVNVGDTIQTETFLGIHKYEITRVTKTLAISKRKIDGREFKFKREIGHDMACPYQPWGTTKYSVIKSRG